MELGKWGESRDQGQSEHGDTREKASRGWETRTGLGQRAVACQRHGAPGSSLSTYALQRVRASFLLQLGN